MMKHSVSLVLLNTHFSINFPQSYLPNMVSFSCHFPIIFMTSMKFSMIINPQIEIGGFHVKNETTPLPADIKTFIESAEHGVVYFSLGSNVKPSVMDETKKRDIIAALSKLKQKVIWKWDDESLKVDKNKFLVRKWLPQDDILAHDNVKLFVTHGGLLSCIESIYRGKPVVGIPVFGDQTVSHTTLE
jgi:glucuronosyltransferase